MHPQLGRVRIECGRAEMAAGLACGDSGDDGERTAGACSCSGDPRDSQTFFTHRRLGDLA
jgi:hypothetical protein